VQNIALSVKVSGDTLYQTRKVGKDTELQDLSKTCKPAILLSCLRIETLRHTRAKRRILM